MTAQDPPASPSSGAGSEAERPATSALPGDCDAAAGPIAAWERAAREALPGTARRVLVVGDGGRPLRAPDDEPWDAVLIGPSWRGAALDLEAARDAVAPGGRLVVAARAGEDAVAAERALLELGCAIRRELPVGGSSSALGEEGARLLVAGYDGTPMRAARDGDEAAILELFERSFHVGRSVEHWRWKYRRNPYGNGRITVATDAAGELLGQYCAYPVRLHHAGAVVPIHQVGDTMTARAARGIGRGPTSVLARMARHFYAAFCTGRVACNYGFNTGNIQQLSIRFVGAHKAAEVSYLERPAGAARPGGGRLRRLLGGYRVREAAATDLEGPLGARFDALFEDCRSAYGSLVERDARYLRWRYLERPDLRYRMLLVERRGRLVGWGVFDRRDLELAWGDALFLPEHADAASELLDAAVGAAGEPRVERVVAWFPPHPRWWRAVLTALGFATRPEPQALGLMVVPFLDAEAPRWMGSSWYYTWGDSDLF
jgi:hypothetical protein